VSARFFWIGSLCAVAFVACGGAPELLPAKTAAAVPGLDNAAVAEDRGVRVVAQSEAWSGETNIDAVLTPMRVRISNGGSAPFAVRYSKLALVAQDGTRYGALPPLAIRGTVPALARPYSPVMRPGFDHYGFDVAPFYHSVYPSTIPYEGPFPYDRSYHDVAYRRWDLLDLPTDEMITAALPEGVLSSGGHVAGFVYFEKVSTQERGVTLRAELVSPDTGAEVAAVSLPFEMTR
jgi:hypothetical protein